MRVMILDAALQQSVCSLLLDNNLDLKKKMLKFTELHKCSQKKMLYFIDQIITDKLHCF